MRGSPVEVLIFATEPKDTMEFTAIPQGWFFHKFSWVEGCIFGYPVLRELPKIPIF